MHPTQPSANEKIGLLAETSWEVCNKIGGIYTVLSTKARVLKEYYGDNLVFIGPDIWTNDNPSPDFKEDNGLFNKFSQKTFSEYDIRVRTGRWDIPGSPQVILVKFQGVYGGLNEIFSKMWEEFGVDSMREYGDYREGCAFSIASAIVIKELSQHLDVPGREVMSHFNEWTTGMGLLYLRLILPEAAELFTTHATSIGRSICGNGKPLYDYFDGYNGDQMACELNMEAKHSLEKTAAHEADCFTAVSDLTAREAEKLLEIKPQVVTPNGFEPDFVPGDRKYRSLRKNGRKILLDIASKLKNREFSDDTLIVATSGRNEYRNKGLDLYLDSLAETQRLNPEKDVLGLVLVPAWVAEPLLLKTSDISFLNQDYVTHNLYNLDTDSVATRIRALESEQRIGGNVNVIYIPCYLNGSDGVVDITYYDLLPAIDLTVFASYYEPWGYTPLESVAFGIPTITTDKSGFGQWVLSGKKNSIFESGVKVTERNDSNYHDTAREIARQIVEYAQANKESREAAMKSAVMTSLQADWKNFIHCYFEAFLIASKRRDKRIRETSKN